MILKADIEVSERIALFYYDQDNEKIVIQDDSDLQMAYAMVVDTDKKIKFQIEF